MSSADANITHGKGFLKATGIIAGLNVLTAVTGLLIDVLLARHFGLGKFTDAFYAAYTVPFFFALLAYSIGYSTLVPVFSRSSEGGREDVSDIVNTYVNIAAVAGLALVLAGMTFMGGVIKLVAPGLDAETSKLAGSLSQILFSIIFFSLVAEVLRSFLYAKKSFYIAVSSNFIRNTAAIVSVAYYHDRFGIASLAYGYAAGYVLQFIVLGLTVYVGHGIRYRATIGSDARKLLATLRVGLAQGTGFSILQGITFAERILGSYLPEGSITALSYASRIAYTAVEFFSGSMATATISSLSQAIGDNDDERVGRIMRQTFQATLVFFLPLTALVIALHEPVIALLFKRGEFTSEDVRLTSWLLMLYGLSFVAQGCNRLIHNYLFALINPRGVLVMFGSLTAITVVSDILLLAPIGISAMPVGYLIGAVVSLGIGAAYYVKGRFAIADKATLVFVSKLSLLSLILGGGAYIIFQYLSGLAWGMTAVVLALQLLVSVGFAFLLAIALAHLLGFKELRRIKAMFRRSES